LGADQVTEKGPLELQFLVELPGLEVADVEELFVGVEERQVVFREKSDYFLVIKVFFPAQKPVLVEVNELPTLEIDEGLFGTPQKYSLHLPSKSTAKSGAWMRFPGGDQR